VSRPVLAEAEVARIRRERRAPRPSQWDYLHLEGLRRALVATGAELAAARGPVLDLFCGTKPYLELLPWRPLWGLDIDRHFGRADVVGDLPLPFRDRAFGVALVTQALHMVDDPVGAVEELARVLAPGGWVVVTVPHLFLAEGDFERHWSAADLGELFAGWADVRVTGIDGPGAAFAFALGRIAMLGARRWRLVRPLFRPSVLVLNVVGSAIDRAAPLTRRWPHSLLLVARRPAAAAGTAATPMVPLRWPRAGRRWRPRSPSWSPVRSARWSGTRAVSARSTRGRWRCSGRRATLSSSSPRRWLPA
jgi:SAM-dependent methyltransferase